MPNVFENVPEGEHAGSLYDVWIQWENWIIFWVGIVSEDIMKKLVLLI